MNWRDTCNVNIGKGIKTKMESITSPFAQQIVYLDFDGELTRYDGEILTIDNVEVQHALLTTERIENILSILDEKYASQNVKFVTERPVSGEYSTIYIGKRNIHTGYRGSSRYSIEKGYAHCT